VNRRPATRFGTVAAAALIGVFGMGGFASGAHLTPDVEASVAAGESRRVIVHLKADLEGAKGLGSSPDAGDQRRLRRVSEVISSFVVDIDDIIASGDLKITRTFRLQPAVVAEVSSDGLVALALDPRVTHVESDRRWRLQTFEGLRLIGADALHQLGISGEGTAVAIIDSGVDYLHPTLGGGQIPNAKVVHGLDTADGDDDPMDCNGHGTAVASVAAGSSYQWSPNRRFAGGVAPAAKIIAYKVTSDEDCSIASTSSVVAAVEDAILRREGDDYRLAAINISLGGGEFPGPCDSANLAYSEVINTAVDAGIVVIAAAGNSGFTDALNVPACINRTISVGSAWDVDPGLVPYRFCLDPDCTVFCDDSFRWQRAVSCYSNSSTYLDLVAPSEYLKAAAAGGVTVGFGGTSGAAAYVTGAAALLAEAQSGIQPIVTKFLLAATGEPTMDDKNGLVRPIVDLATAVDAASKVVVSQDTAKPIRSLPDPPTVSTLSVDRVGLVGSLKVLLDIAHPTPESLRVTLRAPSGTEVVLHDHEPGPDGIAGTYPDDFDPRESLGRFAGEPMQGVWSLSLEDDRLSVADDDGPTLVGWALHFEAQARPPFESATMIFPVVAHIEGAMDTSWRSDIRLFNAADGQEAEVRLLLIPPAGDSASAPRQTDVIVPHGSVVALDDVVMKRFGLETGLGSLIVQDPTGTVVHGTSRTYTTSDLGTYGQFVAPEIAGGHSTGAGEPAVVILPTAGLDHRVNIGITEVTGSPATVAVTLMDSDSGVALGSSTFHHVEGFANVQLNGVLPDPIRSGNGDPYVAVTVVQGEGRVTAYGSAIDNRTGDAVFITGATPRVSPFLLIPVVAHNQGQAGTEWRTDLRVLNHGGFSVHVDAELRFQGALGLPPVVETFELQPGQAITIDDVVGDFFGFHGVVGSLRLVPEEGPAALCATSRTANHGSTGTYGQYVPAIHPDSGLDDRGVLIHLDKDDHSRSNLGIVETDGRSVSVVIEIFDELGRPLGWSRRTTLGPWDSVQINDIFGALGADDQRNARVRLTHDSGMGRFFAYASVIDSRSGDAIFVPVLELTD
jgi:subtilisin family serine protease